uniref:Uncharacterized protein n=1 Tax=Oryza glaberrima TaxID=4538 RepID=I1NVV2_ORYGL
MESCVCACAWPTAPTVVALFATGYEGGGGGGGGG